MVNNFDKIFIDCKNNHGAVESKFEKGQEDCFCEFLNNWHASFKESLKNHEKGEFYYYDLCLSSVVTNSLNNLEWQKIWEKLDDEILVPNDKKIRYCINKLFFRIQKFINADSFVEKSHNSNDIVWNYLLYSNYFNKEDFKVKYIEYLSEFVNRNNCSYEECLKKLYIELHQLNNSGCVLYKISNSGGNRDTYLYKLIDLFLEIGNLNKNAITNDGILNDIIVEYVDKTNDKELEEKWLSLINNNVKTKKSK